MTRLPLRDAWPEPHWKVDQVRAFWRFVCERHNIFVRRHVQKQPPPWTDDPVLKTLYTTNIYRELDRATRYLIRTTLAKMDGPDVLFNVNMFRYFILATSYEAMGAPLPLKDWQPAEASRALKKIQSSGSRVFSGAYMINADHSGRAKVDMVVERLSWLKCRAERMWGQLMEAGSLQGAHQFLMEAPGLGGFMAYEVLIDLCYRHHPKLPYSLDEWVFVGPGAKRGLMTLLLYPSTYTSSRAVQMIESLRDHQESWLDLAQAELWGPRLTLENIEQALCEYQKYVRAGHYVKRKYTGASGTDEWLDLPVEFTTPTLWLHEPKA